MFDSGCSYSGEICASSRATFSPPAKQSQDCGRCVWLLRETQTVEYHTGVRVGIFNVSPPTWATESLLAPLPSLFLLAAALQLDATSGKLKL